MAGELEFSEEMRVQRELQRTGKYGRAVYRALLLLILWIEMTFIMGCLITLLEISFPMRPLFYAGAVCGLVWTVFFSASKKWRYLLLFVYLCVVGIFVYQNMEMIRDGFFYLANSFNKLVYNYYKVSLWRFKTVWEEEACYGAFFALFLQPVGACLAQPLFRGRGRFLSVLLLAGASLFGLVVGLVPVPVFFIGSFFLALLQFSFGGMGAEYYVSNDKVRKEYGDGQKRRVKIAFFLCVVTVFTGFFVSRAVDGEEYKINRELREKKQELQEGFARIAASPVWAEIADAFSGIISLNKIGKDAKIGKIGGLNSGKFSRAEKISFDNVTALVVTLPEVYQPVYLRGYTGASYTEDGWDGLSVEAAKEYAALAQKYGMGSQEQGYRMMDMVYHGTGPILMDFYSAGSGPLITSGSMKVEYITANRRYVYAPYYINPLMQEGFQNEQDGHFFSASREKEYEYSFLMPGMDFLRSFGVLTEKAFNSKNKKVIGWQTNPESVMYRDFSEAYREFVYQYYTQVPEEHKALKELLPGASTATVDGKIEAVLRYLSHYEYTLTPGLMPPDADFVNYFLYENKKGYCVHFASSAVLMLRSLGVPARYAEGYYIAREEIEEGKVVCAGTINERWEIRSYVGGYEMGKKPPSTRAAMQKRVEVRDYAAHAWVEVYLENLGWIPLEVTCGYMEGDEGGRPQEILDEVENLPEPTPIPEPETTPTPKPTITPTATVTPEPTEEIQPTKEAVTDTPEPTPPQKGDTPIPTLTTPPQGDQGQSGTDIKGEPSVPAAWVKPFFAVLVLLLATGLLFFARYRIVWSVRKRRGRERKSQVLWYYTQMERILNRRGIVGEPGESYEDFAKRVEDRALFAGDFLHCQKTALFAGFGRGCISVEEADFVAGIYGEMRRELFGECGLIQKYYLKFIKLY